MDFVQNFSCILAPTIVPIPESVTPKREPVSVNLFMVEQICSVPLCPDSCGNTPNRAKTRGQCSAPSKPSRSKDSINTTTSSSPAHCICQPGFAGDDCSLDENNFVGNTWHFLARPTVITSLVNDVAFHSRTSHSSVYNYETDILGFKRCLEKTEAIHCETGARHP